MHLSLSSWCGGATAATTTIPITITIGVCQVQTGMHCQFYTPLLLRLYLSGGDTHLHMRRGATSRDIHHASLSLVSWCNSCHNNNASHLQAHLQTQTEKLRHTSIFIVPSAGTGTCLGKPSFKKRRYIRKYIHKTVTPPPPPCIDFMKSLFTISH